MSLRDFCDGLLVNLSAEDKKASGDPLLKKVRQMLPKGWGGVSYEDVSASISILSVFKWFETDGLISPRRDWLIGFKV
jgi:hypothetical protein